MVSKAEQFICSEEGAVTVDWVILAAGVVSLALAAVGVITDGTENLSGDVEERLKSPIISTSFQNDSSI